MSSIEEQEIVLVEKKDGVATIFLNRPDSLNALSTALRRSLVDVFISLREDASISAIILTGNGRAFSAGLDLKELGAGNEDNSMAVSDRAMQTAILGVGKPVIAAVNGFAITGGFELALMTDFIVASENAKFADTHAQVGIVPGWGLSQKLPRLVGINRAKEISFTGSFIDAEQAERWGLVNRVVAAEKLLEVCQALAQEMVCADQRTLRTIKKIMDDGWASSLEQGLAIEARANQEHMKEVTPVFLEERRKIVTERGRRKNR